MKKLFTVYTSIALTYAMSAFNQVLAALPTAAAISADTGIDDAASPITFIAALLETGVGTAAVAVSALTVLGVAWTAYSSFVEARQKSEWKNFGVTASIGVVLIVGVVLLSILAVDYVAA